MVGLLLEDLMAVLYQLPLMESRLAALRLGRLEDHESVVPLEDL